VALTGAQRVALMLMTVEPARASAILRHLPEEVVTRIGRQMITLNPDAITREELDATVKKFVRDFKSFAGPARDPGVLFDRLLRLAYEEEAADAILRKIQEEATPGAKALEEVDPRQIAAVMEDDHPQVLAIVLSRVSPAHAARVLDHLPEERRSEVCRRLASMGSPSSELLRRVITAVTGKLFRASTGGSSTGTPEGIRTVALMMKSLGPETSKEVVGKIAKSHPEMAKAIQHQMFTFEDVKGLSKKDIQKVLSQVNVETLALAIKGVDDDFEATLLSNVSQRIADQVREEREILGAVSVDRVKEAQTTIRDRVWEFVENGDIVLRGAEEEQVV